MRSAAILRVLAFVSVLCALPAVVAAQRPVITNQLGMEFVRIEPGMMIVGRFQPVCPTPDPTGADQDPRTRWTAEDYRLCEDLVRREATFGFPVRIQQPYYIGRYEVTQAQYLQVMERNPSHFQGSRVEGDSGLHPVESVTWEDAQRFVESLNGVDGSAHYRLPTEMEWEYAARAGAEDPPSWGQIRAAAWISLVDQGTTRPVGGKEPNAWGLYDTLGNVWEWVEDYYNGKLFADPIPPASGTLRVLRGGSFLSDVKNATYFTHAAGPGNGWDVGFRVVMEPIQP